MYTYSIDQIMELISFTVDNGYVQRGNKIYRQKRGFGMGLPCAGQLANPTCYVVEARQKPEDVEHNHRYASTTSSQLRDAYRPPKTMRWTSVGNVPETTSLSTLAWS